MQVEETLVDLTKRTCQKLSDTGIDFALAGGIAADIYRGETRATEDLDLLVEISAKDVDLAKELVDSLGFTPSIVTEAQLQGNTRFARRAKRSTPQIVVGRAENKPYGVDFLLLSMPWAQTAMERSKSNQINIPSIGLIPCLTVEDLIISKLFALKNNSSRRYRKSDIPDVVLMFEHNSNLDIPYLSNALQELELVLPKIIEQETNYILARISRKNRKKQKSLDY